MDNTWLYISIIASVISIGVAVFLYFWVKRQDPGTEKAQEVASWIREGAQTYLKRLYFALSVVAIILGFIIAIVFSFDLADVAAGQATIQPMSGIRMAIAFISGAVCSAIAGYMGMGIAVEANVRTATAANESLNKAFKLSFYAGSVMGLAMVGLAVLGMTVIYMLTGSAETVLGFSFGASALALLAKAGGGIYTKTADIAADLVGKVEVGIPEDDPRNPAVVADNVGDNVGDVAGMGADIFDSYVASTVAVMLLAAASSTMDVKYVVLPLILCTLGIAASLIGIQFVRVGKNGKPGPALNFGTVLTTVIFAGMVALLVLLSDINIGVLWATLTGLVTGVVIGFTSDYFTSEDRKPVFETARVSGSGAAINIITGFSYGLISIVPSVIGIAVATLLSYYLADAT
ncbi:MAG: sodium/proton-translocating pyrophosphatase, partial [Anaerolineaceae bacterium]|nr:sodium/proton-translocating pyrophosphatase [Anaerolineaceae bacterium]